MRFGPRRSLIPTPVATSLGTSTATRWAGAQAGQTLTGSGFTAASVVYIDGVAMTTVVNSSTSLTFTIPNTVLWTNGAKSVTVRTPKITGGYKESSARTYTVSYAANALANYRADLGVTLTSGRVSAWADQVGNDANKNATQGTSAKRPTRTTANASYNNQSTIDFDASTLQNLVTGIWTTPPTQPTTYFLAGHATNNGIDLFDGYSNAARNALLTTASNKFQMYAGGGVITSTVAAATPAIVEAKFNGVSSAMLINNKTTTAASGNTGSQAITGLAIGSDSSSTFCMTGSIAELLVIDGVPSAGYASEILDYLSARYGIAVAA